VVTGVITSFDEARGDGWLSADDGGKYYFHCLAILDGSRSIATGARASGLRVVGHLGRDEVTEVRAF
jgi:cold shock CspA family protein